MDVLLKKLETRRRRSAVPVGVLELKRAKRANQLGNLSATQCYPNKETLQKVLTDREKHSSHHPPSRLWLSTVAGSSPSVSFTLPPPCSSTPGMGPIFNLMKEENTLHCIGLKWDPRESQTNFCWTKAKTNPEMCTVVMKCRQMEEHE